MKRRAPSAGFDLHLRLSPAVSKALLKMATDDMRSVPNLVRKVLADHLCNHKYLTREEIMTEYSRLNLDEDEL